MPRNRINSTNHLSKCAVICVYYSSGVWFRCFGFISACRLCDEQMRNGDENKALPVFLCNLLCIGRRVCLE